MTNILLVGAGGFLGAVARYGAACLAGLLWKHQFPLGTLLVNLVGCFLIGLLLPGERSLAGEQGRLFLVVGVLGGFTTFSAFGWETLHLWRTGSPGLAAAYVLGSVLLGLAATALGHLAGELVGRS